MAESSEVNEGEDLERESALQEATLARAALAQAEARLSQLLMTSPQHASPSLLSPPAISPKPSIISPTAISPKPSAYDNEPEEEPDWLSNAAAAVSLAREASVERRASAAATGAGSTETALMGAAAKATGDEARAAVTHCSVVSPEPPVRHSASAAAPSPPMLPPHRPESVQIDVGSPLGGDAGPGPLLDGARQSSVEPGAAFWHAVADGRHALRQMRSLSATEVTHGLLELSASCARITHEQITGFAEDVSRAAVQLPTAVQLLNEEHAASGRTRLQLTTARVRSQWRATARSLLQLPIAIFFAVMAMVNVMGAFFLSCAIRAPAAARLAHSVARDWRAESWPAIRANLHMRRLLSSLPASASRLLTAFDETALRRTFFGEVMALPTTRIGLPPLGTSSSGASSSSSSGASSSSRLATTPSVVTVAVSSAGDVPSVALAGPTSTAPPQGETAARLAAAAPAVAPPATSAPTIAPTSTPSTVGRPTSLLDATAAAERKQTGALSLYSDDEHAL